MILSKFLFLGVPISLFFCRPYHVLSVYPGKYLGTFPQALQTHFLKVLSRSIMAQIVTQALLTHIYSAECLVPAHLLNFLFFWLCCLMSHLTLEVRCSLAGCFCFRLSTETEWEESCSLFYSFWPQLWSQDKNSFSGMQKQVRYGGLNHVPYKDVGDSSSHFVLWMGTRW